MGGQGGCEWRSEALVKINFIFVWGGGVGSGGGGGLGGGGLGGQGGWERRIIEAFVKIQKKNYTFLGGGHGGGGSGRRVWGSGWM